MESIPGLLKHLQIRAQDFVFGLDGAGGGGGGGGIKLYYLKVS